MASIFDDFIKAVLEGAKGLAKDILNGFEDQAKEDAEAFLKITEDDLNRWTELLVEKKLTEQDFGDLVRNKFRTISLNGRQ